MIPADKSRFLGPLFHFYFRGLARKAFHTIAVRGLEQLQNLPRENPVLVFSNHTNWWDGLLAYLLLPYLRDREGYLMMEEKQLAQYTFFARMGAFSVDLDRPGKSAQSLRYTLKLLQNPRNLVWIFPQGKICPPHQTMHVMPGTSFLARKAARVLLLPVAFRYEFFRENRPNALIEIGAPFPGLEGDEARIQEELQKVFTQVDRAATAQDLTGFTPLYPPALSINKKWEWVLLACQGRLGEFRAEN